MNTLPNEKHGVLSPLFTSVNDCTRCMSTENHALGTEQNKTVFRLFMLLLLAQSVDLHLYIFYMVCNVISRFKLIHIICIEVYFDIHRFMGRMSHLCHSKENSICLTRKDSQVVDSRIYTLASIMYKTKN